MHIKIDKSGRLSIDRGNNYKYQYCPFSTDEDRCGDWCPLFSIYEEIQQDESGKNIGPNLDHL